MKRFVDIRNRLRKAKLPPYLKITIYAFPLLSTTLFYLLRGNSNIMQWFSLNIAAPLRAFNGMLSAIFPFSVMEIFVTVAVIALVYFIVKSVKLIKRSDAKLKHLGRRLVLLVTVVLYLWSAQIWLWNSGYFAPGFAERNGFSSDGISLAELADVTWHFADRANEYALLVPRDENGHVLLNRTELFDQSTDVFNYIVYEFPCLSGRLFRPKPMMFSWIMSRTGYSGIYFAITGEANINVNMPIFLMPTTIAHEHAHQLGVFAEDEANFVAVLASITSGIPAYQYAGYLFGLMRLMRPIREHDNELWQEISSSLNEYVLRDWRMNSEYWQSQRVFQTGNQTLDRALTTVGRVTRETVDSIYDSFLRANRQELGLQSYGAVVDLLVEYFARMRPDLLTVNNNEV